MTNHSATQQMIARLQLDESEREWAMATIEYAQDDGWDAAQTLQAAFQNRADQGEYRFPHGKEHIDWTAVVATLTA